jgi:hypothetical protein
VIRDVDHVVLAVDAGGRRSLAERLLAAGFVDIPLHLDFPEIGAASDSYAMAGGGFVELVYETRRGAAPAAWFQEVPRVIGLGFMSDEFDADVGAWGEPDGMWLMDEDQVLSDGTVLNIHAAGPHPHFEDFYVFVMDRLELPYPHLGARPRLDAITFAGERADEWGSSLSKWLRARREGDELRVGEVALRFRRGAHPSAHVSLEFAVEGPADVVPLATGEILLTQEGLAK